MAEYWLWLKAAHVAAVMSWMAGLFYLPRLFVYHSGTVAGSEASELFKVMERRLLKAIMTPAMVVSWGLGLWLIFSIGFDGVWLWIKLVCVVALSAFHVWMARFVRLFAADARPADQRFFRLVNEIPTVLMLVIVAMVVVKPFS